VIRIRSDKNNWLSTQDSKMINTDKFKAMDEEGDRLVGMKGPMPSRLMSILYVIYVKLGNILLYKGNNETS
jgi:hypothetical protein